MGVHPERPPALEARGLVLRYPQGLLRRPLEVLRGLDLEVRPGTRLALCGPNGSGKSTLLSLAAGVRRPSAGSLRVFGQPPRERPLLARLGYLPDRPALPEELDLASLLSLVAGLRGFGGRERREAVARALERVGLAEAARRPFGKLSLGMRRRFGLAEAFLGEPDLLLLDEPTFGLDAPGFLVLDELLDEAVARGATVILASHVLSDLTERCDEVAVLLDGRLAARGAASELFTDAGGLVELYRRLARTGA